MKYKCGGGDYACLKSTAGTEVTVKLHIEAEHQDKRDKQFGGNAQDDIQDHDVHPG